MKNEPLPPQSIVTVALADMRPSPTNPRKTFAGVEDLAASIREHGVLQDILVRPIGAKVTFDKKSQSWECDHFEIVAGERRFRAAKLAGLTELQVKVRPLTDAEVLEIQLVENDQREDVKPTEQAAAYKRLVDAVGLAEAAKRIGKAESTVRGIVQLAKAPPALAQAVDAGIVSRSVAQLVCRVPGESSRERAAGCVLLGEMHPAALEDDWRDTRTDDLPPLTHRETKELIGRHFTRVLKTAPFSRKTLYTLADAEGQTRIGHDCEGCPNRAGNDPAAKAEGVRADVCLDPECFEEKVDSHRQTEIEKFAKRYKVDVASVPTIEMNGTIPAGWVETTDKVLDTELARDGDGYTDWKHKPKPDVTVLELLTSPDGIPTILPGTCRLRLAIDAKGKPHTLIKAADIRKNLIRAEIIAKPVPKTTTKTIAKGEASADEPAFVLYRIKWDQNALDAPIEFSVAAGCGGQELDDAAAEAVYLAAAYRAERVPEAEAGIGPKPAAAETTPKPFGYDDLIRRALHCRSDCESRWKKLIAKGATDAEIKAVLADVWGSGGGSTGPASESRPHFDCRYKGGSSPSLECELGNDPDGPLKLKGISLIDRVRSVIGIPRPEAQTSAPAPGPIVCAPIGSGRLADIAGITKEDAACLHAVGIITLAGLEQKLDALRAERGRQNATIYDVLRTYGGAFTPGDAERIGDAVMDHLNVAKAVGATVDAAPKAKGKRKAVAK